ncbi:MAG: dephospho-CoA kinase [Firmicutes bacterium]|nr:dephospho-CoA kinase [Bacillota bacterium]
MRGFDRTNQSRGKKYPFLPALPKVGSRVYGLTGSIATGKSTVAGMLRELGSAVIDADRIAKDVTALGQPGWYEVLKAFPEVVTAEQGIDRKKLAELIFDDRQKRKRLETIIHPLVFAEIKKEATLLERSGKVVFADIPLLYETNCQSWIDFVVVVYVPEPVQLERVMRRDQLTRSEALKRIKAQWPIELKRQLADYVIDNSGTFDQTRDQVDRLWQRIIE